MTSRQIAQQGIEILIKQPQMATFENVTALRIATRLTWEREEMGGLEHVQFAYRNGTPIVPPNHCCHPVQLKARGFVDGAGWPNQKTSRIRLHQWPDGRHWYAYLDGEQVIDNGLEKWSTSVAAEAAAIRALQRKTPQPDSNSTPN